MIWVEVLSRHRDVLERRRCEGPQVRIGRSYANDVVIDDPFVAAAHLRVFRDESGSLVAQDLGSANGLFAGHGGTRAERLVLDGEQPIRIGRTYLRIRAAGHAVPAERALPVRVYGGRMVVALAASIVAIETASQWLGDTREFQATRFVLPLLALVLLALAWTGMWSILSRVFTGQARFDRHLLVALAGLAALSVLTDLAGFGAFAFSLPALAIYEYAVIWICVAAACYFHLREMGRSRLPVKALAVGALAVVSIAAQTLVRSEGGASSGRQEYLRDLKPPFLRLVPAQREAAFFGRVEDLKAKLDEARAAAVPADAGSSGQEAEE
ncbi:MAG: FHA domain-containing protein [Burkholderiales bacterium]|nr:FHA domain-containing protein [Burkholderiales bacterium]